MKPIKIDIAADQIEDLKNRLLTTRWPDEIKESNWDYGTNLSYLKKLCSYWKNDFNWQTHQDAINEFNHYTTEIDNQTLHFIYQRGKGITNFPLMLIHGWPDSFYRFIKLIPLLIEPDEKGFAFDVIIPSIPGFGFSEKSKERGMGPVKIAMMFNKLMNKTLGYRDFYVHGGDWGASISTQMAIQCEHFIKGLHLTNVPPELFFTANSNEFNEQENLYLQFSVKRQKDEGAYLAIQSSKPQTIAYGLNDSPSGLAGWIIEKFCSWSDNNGDIENSFSKNELLVNISIYWFTETAGSSARIYYEALRQVTTTSIKKITVPTYFAIFPADSIKIPESFGRRLYNVQDWSNMASGGHFTAMEVPELLAKNIRDAFFK